MVDLQNCLSFRCTAKWFRYMVALVVKNPPANADIRDSDLIPGLGRSPAGGVATHSSILAWEIPRTEEPGGLQSAGLRNSWMWLTDWTKIIYTHTYIHIHIYMYRCLILWCPLLRPSIFPSIREGWDGFMASLMQWTWTWANSRRKWRREMPGVLQSMGLQGQTWLGDWTTMEYVYHVFTYPYADGHLGCFHVLAIVNSATSVFNIEVHVSFWLAFSSVLDI